jgi:hypothetical protein
MEFRAGLRMKVHLYIRRFCFHSIGTCCPAPLLAIYIYIYIWYPNWSYGRNVEELYGRRKNYSGERFVTRRASYTQDTSDLLLVLPSSASFLHTFFIPSRFVSRGFPSFFLFPLLSFSEPQPPYSLLLVHFYVFFSDFYFVFFSFFVSVFLSSTWFLLLSFLSFNFFAALLFHFPSIFLSFDFLPFLCYLLLYLCIHLFIQWMDGWMDGVSFRYECWRCKHMWKANKCQLHYKCLLSTEDYAQPKSPVGKRWDTWGFHGGEDSSRCLLECGSIQWCGRTPEDGDLSIQNISLLWSTMDTTLLPYTPNTVHWYKEHQFMYLTTIRLTSGRNKIHFRYYASCSR